MNKDKRDKICVQLEQMRQLIESRVTATPQEKYCDRAICAVLHALEQAIENKTEIQLQRQIDRFMLEEMIRAVKN